MKTTLITTLFNESENILRFLQSYSNQTRYSDEFVIVDGGSTDGTIDLIDTFSRANPRLNIRLIVDKTCSKKYVSGPVAKGRNVAVKNALYDFIVATDAGCILDRHWFEEIVKPFEMDDVDVVSGFYLPLIENKFQEDYAKVAMPSIENIDPNTFLPSSRSIAFKKECWQKVGGYPTSTLTAEDTKFDLDLKRKGFKFAFAKKAIVYWECPRNMAEAKKKHYLYSMGEGQLRLFKMKYFKSVLKLIFPLILRSKCDSSINVRLNYILILFSVLGYFIGLVRGVRKVV